MQDQIIQILTPFLPMAAFAAAVVAIVRDLWPKKPDGSVGVDGRAVVALAAVASVVVVVWAQARTGSVQWLRVLTDAPPTFFLAVGGTKWFQRLRDRSSTTHDVTVSADVTADIVADLTQQGKMGNFEVRKD